MPGFQKGLKRVAYLTTAIHASICATAFSMSSAYAQPLFHLPIEWEIMQQLSDMGYEESLAENCTLAFSRAIEPTPENNEYSLYVRIMHLENISKLEESEVFDLHSNGKELFFITAPFTEEYLHRYRRVYDFHAFILNEFGAGSWPYPHPEDYSEKVSEVEALSLVFFGPTSRMDKWINFTKFGTTTNFPRGFSLSAGSKEELLKFQALVLEYMQVAKCSTPSAIPTFKVEKLKHKSRD